MGSCSICFNATAKKELRQISKPFLSKIMERIQRLQEDPRPYGVKLLKGAERYYRIRQGDYRIVYEINDEMALITIVAVGHRREVYE